MDDSRARTRRLRPTDQGGFALVEVMVSAVVLVAMALGTFKVIDDAGTRAGTNRARGVATSLAGQDQDRLRVMPVASLADLNQTQTKSSNGFNFTVASTAVWVSDSTGPVACNANTGAAQYLRITSTVTWPNMNGVDPVVVQSLVTPKIGDTNKGSLVVFVKNEAGGGVSGVTVSAQSQSAATDAAGCAYLARLTQGETNVTLSRSGYVGKGGDSVPSQTVMIAAGQTAVIPTWSYDQAATIPITIKDTAKTSPATLAYNAVTAFSGSNVRRFSFSAASTTNLTNLYPFSAGYSIYAGNCDGNRPTPNYAGNTNYYTATSPATPLYPTAFTLVTPGGITAGKYAMVRRLSITLTRNSMTSWYWSAVPEPTDSRMAGCPILSGSSTFSSANSKNFTIDLPYGVYDLCFESRTGGSGTARSRWMTGASSTGGAATNTTAYKNTPMDSTSPDVRTANTSLSVNTETPSTNYTAAQCPTT